MGTVTLTYEKSYLAKSFSYTAYRRGSAVKECCLSDKDMQAVLRPLLQE